MPQDYSDLYHTRKSTRHFLYSKAEAEDLEKKRTRTSARIQKSIKSVYPNLLADHSFVHHAAQQLSSAKVFACAVFQIDDETGTDPARTKSDPVTAHTAVAKGIDDLCRQHNGSWGLVNSGFLGAFFNGMNAIQCLKLIQELQEILKQKTNIALSAGIAEYPKLNYNPAEMLSNAQKALDHASFFGPGSAAIFDAVSLNISADKLFDKGDIDGSIDEFKRALKLDPSNINVHNSLGVCYGIIGDYAEAISEFNAAIRLNSKEIMPWYNLGFTHMLGGNRTKALDLFLKANTINQDVFEVVFQTGRLLVEMEQPESGKKYLEHATRLDPGSGAAYRYLGECYTSIGRPDEAIAAYKSAIKQNPSDAASLSAMGCLFDTQDENPEISLMFCQESVKLSPENGLFRYRLGQLYLKQDRLDDALKEFKKADLLGQDASEYITKIQKRRPAKAS
jgi:tetratricopeptide (TPR) repeat protein